MFELKVLEKIDSAHFLPNHCGKCKNLHGHNWKIEVVICSSKLDDNGFVIDFTEIKNIINELDHKLLNDYVQIPTAENLAKYLYEKIIKEVPATKCKVTIWETENNSVSYHEDH